MLQEREGPCVFSYFPWHPATLFWSQSPYLGNQKGRRFQSQMKHPDKNNMLWTGHDMASHTPGFSPGLHWPLAAGQGLSISQWFFPLSRSPVVVSGARIPGPRFVSGPSGVVLVTVVTPKAAVLAQICTEMSFSSPCFSNPGRVERLVFGRQCCCGEMSVCAVQEGALQATSVPLMSLPESY